jgi:hypothetical protein
MSSKYPSKIAAAPMTLKMMPEVINKKLAGHSNEMLVHDTRCTDRGTRVEVERIL